MGIILISTNTTIIVDIFNKFPTNKIFNGNNLSIQSAKRCFVIGKTLSSVSIIFK